MSLFVYRDLVNKEGLQKELDIVKSLEREFEYWRNYVSEDYLLRLQLRGRDTYNKGDLVYVLYPHGKEMCYASIKVGSKYITVFRGNSNYVLAKMDIKYSMNGRQGFTFYPDYNYRSAFLFFSLEGMVEFIHSFKETVELWRLWEASKANLMSLSKEDKETISVILSSIKSRDKEV